MAPGCLPRMLPGVDAAVVTGAGRGLGRAIAERLARRGLAVTCVDLDEEAAADAAAELGGEATAALLDVGDPDGCRAVAREAGARGRLAVWVNNAGTQWAGPLWEQPDAAVERLVRTNLIGVVNGCRAAVEQMREDGGPGRILNVASLAGLAPTPGFALYGATKHGVVGLAAALNVELREAGLPISVTTVCPDPIDTRMVWDVVHEPGSALIFAAPRIMSVDEVADAALAAMDAERPLVSVPRYRGAIARALGSFPRATRRVAPAMLRMGERARRRREREREPA